MKLMKEIHAEVEIETVAGISSFNGSASRLGIPLADGDDHVAIIPATDNYEARGMRLKIMMQWCL